MEIRQLRYFVAVAEEMHFKNAAARLHIAQPALSQQIRALEKDLGTALFNRTTRRVEMTAAGEALLPAARHILAEAVAAERLVTQASHGVLGTVRIGFVSSAAIEVVPAMRRYLKDRWPEVEVELREITSTRILTDLRQRNIDVGIVRETVRYPEGISMRALYNEPLVLAVPCDHPLAEREQVRLHELSHETFITFREDNPAGLSGRITQLLQEADIRYTSGQEAVQFVTMVGLVAAQLGVAIVPSAMRHLRLPGVTFLPIADKNAFSTVAFACRSEDNQDLLVKNCLRAAVVMTSGDDFAKPSPPAPMH